MSFDVAADAYGRFMGQYSEPLGREFARFAGVSTGQRVLDVGCGPGALTARLVEILGADAVAAIDPSASFVDAAAARFPGVEVHLGTAEDLPYADDEFDAALAQLVVHFMSDPVAGLAEMARVVRPGGTVAACVWDHAGGLGPLSLFWTAVLDLDPGAPHEADLAGAREGHLAELATTAGLRGRRAGPAHRQRRLRPRRRLVGAVHARRGACRCLRRRPGRGGPPTAAPTLHGAPAGAAVHHRRLGLVHPRPDLSQPTVTTSLDRWAER